MPTIVRQYRSKLVAGGGASRAKLAKVKLSHILGALAVFIIGLLFLVTKKVMSSSSPTLIDSNRIAQNEGHHHPLPKWIVDYVHWHKQMRAVFPGSRLFTDPSAPPLLIRTCLGLCGGLNDRLGQLPWDLYLANQTGRILLLHWHRPVPLENFLVPPPMHDDDDASFIDWRVSQDIPGFFSKGVRVTREGMKTVRDIPELFDGFNSEHPGADFWAEHLDMAIKRATTGSFKDKKILRHRLLGHLNEEELESRLKTLGEGDMIHWTPSFGNIFRMFFRPSEGVEKDLSTVYQTLGMQPGEYSAVHCRVRHPKATPADVFVKGKNDAYPADKTGLPWEGELRLFAVETATRAIKCAKTLLTTSREQIYLFSDSNDLVRYMSHELTDSSYVANHATTFKTSKSDAAALEVIRSANVIARDMAEENAHIDLQKGRDPPAYYATFVDLFLAVNARCVTYGIGYYAVLATKISGTKCKLLYQEEFWGGVESKRTKVRQCFLS